MLHATLQPTPCICFTAEVKFVLNVLWFVSGGTEYSRRSDRHTAQYSSRRADSDHVFDVTLLCLQTSTTTAFSGLTLYQAAPSKERKQKQNTTAHWLLFLSNEMSPAKEQPLKHYANRRKQKNRTQNTTAHWSLLLK